MIAFTDVQRSSAADQLQAYALWAVASRRDAEHCADLALAAVADDVATILRALATIVGPADIGPFMDVYRANGGGYDGLQAIARKALAEWGS